MQWRYRHPGIDPDLKQKAEEIAARARAKRLAQAEAETAVVEATAVEPEQELEMVEKKEMEETAVSEADVRTAHGRFVQGESIKELAQELSLPWQTLRAQFRQYGLSAGRVETAVVPVQKAVETAVSPPASSQANPVAVADGMDRIISLGRLVRDLQAAGVDVKVSGRVVVELEF